MQTATFANLKEEHGFTPSMQVGTEFEYKDIVEHNKRLLEAERQGGAANKAEGLDIDVITLRGIACDSESRRIATITDGHPTIYGFDDLISCETIVDDETLTTTVRNNQVAGAILLGILLGVVGALVGALVYAERRYGYGEVSFSGFGAIVWGVSFGGFGVLVGALTSMKKTTRTIKNVKIKLIFNNLTNPTYELQLMPRYLAEQAIQEARMLADYFTVVLRQNQKGIGTQKDMRNCPFCAEEVKIAAILCKHCGKDLPKFDG